MQIHVRTTLSGAAGRCLVALVVVIATDASANDTPPVGTGVGQTYPDFWLPKLDGGLGRLSDYRGRKVLLIHFASW